MEMNMHDSTLDLFDKVGRPPEDNEALSAQYEVTCDYYEAEFLGLEDYI